MNFIKYISVVLFMGVATVMVSDTATAQPNQCEGYDILTSDQKRVLRAAYHYGKPYDYGLTMAAIALKESSAGQFKLNYLSNDFGVMQINIVTASRTMGITNRFHKMRLAERLVKDDEFSYYLAHSVLDHFQGRRYMTNEVWQEMVKSYNRGYQWKTDPEENATAELYLADVRRNVNLLRRCTSWAK